MNTFVIEINNPTEENMDALNDLMNQMQDQTIEYIQNLSRDLNVSEECASDIFYLRTRSRHTQELENQLIELHKKGTPPNIMEFGCKT